MSKIIKVLLLVMSIIPVCHAGLSLGTQDPDFVLSYITAVKQAHEQLLQTVWALENQKNIKKKQAIWQKKQEFSTESLPEFMSTAEQIQRELNCKVDVAQNSKRLPDQSEHIAQVDKAGRVTIIDQASGKQLRTIKQLSKAHCAVFSQSGTYLATADQESIKVLDTKSYRILYEILTYAPVSNLTFSADSASLACMTKTGKVQIYNAQTGELVSKFDNGRAAQLFAFSRDNKYMILRTNLWRTPQDSQDPYRLTVWEYKK